MPPEEKRYRGAVFPTRYPYRLGVGAFVCLTCGALVSNLAGELALHDDWHDFIQQRLEEGTDA